MRLTQIEKTSAVWVKLDAELNEQLVSLRSQNDCDLSAEATAKLRGRIAQLKQILSLGEDQEIVQTSDD